MRQLDEGERHGRECSRAGLCYKYATQSRPRTYIWKRKKSDLKAALIDILSVGARGFEPPTTTTPLWCATGLRYAPLMRT